MNNRRLLSTLALLMCFCMGMLAKPPKYVFYFIGDGMGLNQVMATQYYLRSCEGQLGITPLCFAQFPYTGIATSYSASRAETSPASSVPFSRVRNKKALVSLSLIIPLKRSVAPPTGITI